jgi:hypothetical protein
LSCPTAPIWCRRQSASQAQIPQTLKLANGATLKAIPTDAKKYAVLTIGGVSDVWVLGGTLEGDRDQHRGKAGAAGGASASTMTPNTSPSAG